MKLTPVIALLGESGEADLETRRLMLVSKFALKIWSNQNSLLRELLLSLEEIVRKNQFWKKNYIPPLVQVIQNIKHQKLNIYISEVLPYFSIEAQILSMPIHTFFSSKDR